MKRQKQTEPTRSGSEWLVSSNRWLIDVARFAMRQNSELWILTVHFLYLYRFGDVVKKRCNQISCWCCHFSISHAWQRDYDRRQATNVMLTFRKKFKRNESMNLNIWFEFQLIFIEIWNKWFALLWIVSLVHSKYCIHLKVSLLVQLARKCVIWTWQVQRRLDCFDNPICLTL